MKVKEKLNQMICTVNFNAYKIKKAKIKYRDGYYLTHKSRFKMKVLEMQGIF
jgi:hypothetical protein